MQELDIVPLCRNGIGKVTTQSLEIPSMGPHCWSSSPCPPNWKLGLDQGMGHRARRRVISYKGPFCIYNALRGFRSLESAFVVPPGWNQLTSWSADFSSVGLWHLLGFGALGGYVSAWSVSELSHQTTVRHVQSRIKLLNKTLRCENIERAPTNSEGKLWFLVSNLFHKNSSVISNWGYICLFLYNTILI